MWNSPPVAEWAMGDQTVVVFAPHPDDDAIGCGGTLSLLAAQGARCVVVYLTDGSGSHPASTRFNAAELARIRAGEARRALTTLGIEVEPIFLNATDGRLANLMKSERMRIVERLAEILRAEKPALAFAPWRRDVHPDHVASAGLIEDAAARARFKQLLFYPVWQPLQGTDEDAPRKGEVTTVCVEISPWHLARKRRAIAEHRSQTGSVVDDDPNGFRIDSSMLSAWTRASETFFQPVQR